MSEAGIAVYGFDAHGHGKSDPAAKSERAYIEAFQHLVDDYEEVIDGVIRGTGTGAAAAPPHAPSFVGGQSMGGLVAAHVALQSQERFAGLLLHSPALDVEWTPMLRIQAQMGGLLAALAPHGRLVPAVRPEDMSQDPEVVRAYMEDPLNTQGNICARSGNELLKAFRQLGSRASQLKLPLYIGHGDQDKCTSLPASARFVEAVSSPDATLHVYKGGYHELLHGPEWQDATDRMIEWMTKRSGQGRSKL
ncbi:hypothetical protein FOA52_008133 [Chlamydomonas sp. UWO 241]|nr:hypothetical protein FOA52_008133 [Chlamydomonas sp. UWO 241]